MQEATAAFAHLHWGLSRERASMLLYASQHIVRMALAPHWDSHDTWNPTHDIRSAVSHLRVDPVIMRTACCGKCYKSYSLNNLPLLCDWKERRTCHKLCGEPLTAQRWTPQGQITVPRRFYSIQSFEDWLQWFMLRPGIETLLEKSWAHQAPNNGTMRILWDTPAWQQAMASAGGRNRLIFGLFYDGFNPLHNKVAGKTVSCGVLTLVCLNLPHELWRQPGNFCILGFTPPPGGPTPVTITALLDPIVDMLAPYEHDRLIPSHKYPAGRSLSAHVIPLIADKLAAHKAAGFGSHSCRYFCADCLCTLDELARLDLDAWTLRDNAAVRAAAANWAAAPTLAERKKLFKSSGIRDSALHRLTYRDHIRHNVIGVMHNILEGVLQHHFRRVWGFAVNDQDAQPYSVGGIPPAPPDLMDVDDSTRAEKRAQDESEALAELGHLRLENLNRGDDVGAATRFRMVNASTLTIGSGTTGSSDPDYIPDADDDSDSDWDSTDGLNGPTASRNPFQRTQSRVPLLPTFDEEDIDEVRAGISEMIVPTWFELPPANIGQKSHGKLKAVQWLNLHTCPLPPVVVEIWTRLPSPRRRALLDNFHSLVSATNIVCDYTTSATLADEYTLHIVAYRKSLAELWPDAIPVPNHHYAMHLGEQMKFWGPPMLLSEFPFEAAIGVAQDVNTNNHYCMCFKLNCSSV